MSGSKAGGAKWAMYWVMAGWVTAVMWVAPAAGQGDAGRSILSRSKSEPPRFPEASSDLALPSFVPVDDADLGTLRILRESRDYEPFSFSIASGLYYTDNAGLDQQDEIEDGYWWNSAGVSYVPQIVGGLSGEIGVSYEMFRYDSSGFLDFDELEAGAGLIYVVREWGDLTLFARYNYDRIMEPRDYQEVYVQHGIVTGFYKPYVIDRKQFLYIRGEAEIGIDTNPDYAKQNDYQVLAGYRVWATDDLWIEPYYRVRFLDFRCGCREDLSHTLGLGVNYRLSEKLVAGVSSYYVWNDSNHAFGDYEAGTVGGSLGFQVRF